METGEMVNMRNGWIVTILAMSIWLVLCGIACVGWYGQGLSCEPRGMVGAEDTTW